jgi:AcrR family transcriptional regulator
MAKRKRPMTEKSTKDRILDAAEHLFAVKGYHNTSLREITGVANANLASVNYHFGSKENLLAAIIDRRIVPINQKRLQILEQIRKTAKEENRRPRSESILRAFIEPTFDIFESGPGGRDFQAIVSQAHNDPDDTVRNLFIDRVIPLVMEFLGALCEALPNLTREIIFSRFMFVIGAMAHTLVHYRTAERFPKMHVKITYPADARFLAEELIAFAVRGLGET